MFWVVEKRDDAILGLTSGAKTERVVDGPFVGEEEAYEIKTRHSLYSSTNFWYTVVESDDKPESKWDKYEFVDAQWEFEDV